MTKFAERTKANRCACGNRFMRFAPRQINCLYCILKAKPKKPADIKERRDTAAFDEWFIYQWHNVRRNGAKLRGVEFEFDDGVVEFAKGGSR